MTCKDVHLKAVNRGNGLDSKATGWTEVDAMGKVIKRLSIPVFCEVL